MRFRKLPVHRCLSVCEPVYRLESPRSFVPVYRTTEKFVVASYQYRYEWICKNCGNTGIAVCQGLTYCDSPGEYDRLFRKFHRE